MPFQTPTRTPLKIPNDQSRLPWIVMVALINSPYKIIQKTVRLASNYGRLHAHFSHCGGQNPVRPKSSSKFSYTFVHAIQNSRFRMMKSGCHRQSVTDGWMQLLAYLFYNCFSKATGDDVGDKQINEIVECGCTDVQTDRKGYRLGMG
uniref:HTH_48 domain-containing protein n=1 Tax=Panagrellus redivivus TaxID=6233 RepID=A0A7E4V8D4_PANRE